MKKIYSTKNPAEMVIVRTLLADAGIDNTILNSHTASAMAGISIVSAGPELWILHDEDAPAAKAVIEKYRTGAVVNELPSKPWVCPDCGEQIEGQFTQCWNCEVEDPREDATAKCLQCGYLLRDLPTRRCPECGTEF